MKEAPDTAVLWRRLGTGDRHAFDLLYRRYERDVVRYCQAVLRDEDDARVAANITTPSLPASAAVPGQGGGAKPR